MGTGTCHNGGTGRSMGKERSFTGLTGVEPSHGVWQASMLKQWQGDELLRLFSNGQRRGVRPSDVHGVRLRPSILSEAQRRP